MATIINVFEKYFLCVVTGAESGCVVWALMCKMASEMETAEINGLQICPRKERILQKRLRNSGQEYVSRSGKLIPAKSQPGMLCNCPQRCDDKVPAQVRIQLFAEFYKMGDHSLQNDFLMAHIKTRAVQRRAIEIKVPGRNKRRVSCKYQVPLLCNSSKHIEPGPSPPDVQLVEVCQKAFMNVFAITEKRVRLQRERLIALVVGRKTTSADVADSQPETKIPRERVRVMPVQALAPRQRDIALVALTPRQQDIAMVDNFFMNQLWKPEYINIK